MFLKENKETQKSFFLTTNSSVSSCLLGKKLQKTIEEPENKNNFSKTKIHGIIFKKNDSEKVTKKISCNCKNSQCLKLYCECFSKLAFCDPEICSCKGCANTKENEQSREALINLYITKNPKTFKKRFYLVNKNIENTTTDPSEAINIRLNSYSCSDSINLSLSNLEKGCTCKKSNCQKKYCECFQNGGACSSLCKCVDCKNSKMELKSPDSTRSSSFFSNKINISNSKTNSHALEFTKTEIETTLSIVDFKKKVIEPCKIIIKDYKLTEEQILI